MAFGDPAQVGKYLTPRQPLALPADPAPRFVLPLAITFIYLGQRVLCLPVHRDDGGIGAVLYRCPECGCVQTAGSGILSDRGIDSACLRCVDPTCALHLHVDDTLARRIPAVD